MRSSWIEEMGIHSRTSASGGLGTQDANVITLGRLFGIGAFGVCTSLAVWGKCSGRSLATALAYTPALSQCWQTSTHLYRSLSVGSLKAYGVSQGKQAQGSNSESCIQSVHAVPPSDRHSSEDTSDSAILIALTSSVPTWRSSSSECSSPSSPSMFPAGRREGGGRSGPPSLCFLDLQSRRKCPLRPQA